MKTKEIIDALYYDAGKQRTNFRIAYAEVKDGEVKHSQWTPYLEGQGKAIINRANQRELLRNEIVLDCDGKDYQALIEKVKSDGWKFTAYATEDGRAQHIHLLFDNKLADLSEEKRRQHRDYLIRKYDCDTQLSTDKHMIAIEGVPHWKTGKVKNLLSESKGLNSTHKLEAEREENSVDVLRLLLEGKRPEAIESISQTIIKKNHIHTIRDDERPEMWIYHEGVYVPNGKTFVKQYVENILGSAYTSQLGNAVLEKVMISTFIEAKDFFISEPVNLLCLENGILDMKERALRQHTHELRFFNKLPVKYNPQAKCPKIKKFIVSIVKNPKEDFIIVQEISGFILHKEYSFEKAFMFTGEGRNGKGKLLEIFKRFVGADNAANIPLQKLEDNFATSQLFGKMVNLGADISRASLRDTGMFKQLTGRDLISADRKFKNMIHFVNYAKMIFCANEIPRTSDMSPAFFQRWIIIEFPYTFVPKHEYEKVEKNQYTRIQNPHIVEDILSEDELSGFLNWALEGRDRIFKNGSFSHSQTVQEVQEAWIRKSDSLRAFIMDCCKLDYDVFVSKKDFLQSYSTYCRQHKVKIRGDKAIKSVLAEEGVSDSRSSTDNRERIWQGIKLVQDVQAVQGISGSKGFPKTLESQNTLDTLDTLDRKVAVYVSEQPKQEVKIDSVIAHFEGLGDSEADIEAAISKAKEAGDIFEPKCGVLKTL